MGRGADRGATRTGAEKTVRKHVTWKHLLRRLLWKECGAASTSCGFLDIILAPGVQHRRDAVVDAAKKWEEGEGSDAENDLKRAEEAHP